MFPERQVIPRILLLLQHSTRNFLPNALSIRYYALNQFCQLDMCVYIYVFSIYNEISLEIYILKFNLPRITYLYSIFGELDKKYDLHFKLEKKKYIDIYLLSLNE